jgi:hypothetical protein
MKLGKIPQNIHNFMENIVLSSPQQIKKRRPLSNLSKQCLKELLGKFKTASHNFQNNMLKNIPYPEDTYKQEDLFVTIPQEIRNKILSSPKTTHSFELMVGSRLIKIHIMLPIDVSQETKRIMKYIRKIGHLIYIWFSIVSDYANCECGKTTEIFLYMTQFYKKKPDQGPIDVIHANTAVTRTCEKRSIIQIYREEEWFKVLIHETFHSLGLDFSGMTEINTTFSKMIQEMYHIPTDGLLFETYCETWATILNAMFLVAFMEDYPRTHKNIIPKIENFLWMESKFSLFQSNKVLKHMNIQYYDLLHSTIPVSRHRLQKYQEKTNVFCYYVLKSVLLYHLDEYLTWCWIHNQGSLDFVKTTGNVKDFYDLIFKLFHNPTYAEEHLFMEKKLNVDPNDSGIRPSLLEPKTHPHIVTDEFSSSMRTGEVEDDIVYKTLRMTIYG